MSVQHDPGIPWPEYVAETYAAHRDELLRSLRRRLGSGELAEDVLQEAALQACTARGPRPANVAAWLHTVALRRGIDALRRRESPQNPGTDVPDHRPDAHAQLLTRTELGVLRVAMRELPARQRKALALQVLEGASTQQIADRLGVTEVGAKALVHRARRVLTERIAEVDLSCGEIRGQWDDASSRGVRAPARVHRHVARCPGCAAYLGGRRTLRARCSAVVGALWMRLPWESAGRVAPMADAQLLTGGKVCAGICVVALLGPGVGALTPPRASTPPLPASTAPTGAAAPKVTDSGSGLRIASAANAVSGPAALSGAGGASSNAGSESTVARDTKRVAHVPPWIVDLARQTSVLRDCSDTACRVRTRSRDRPLTAAEVDRARRLYRVIKANNPSLERRRLRSEVATVPGRAGFSLSSTTPPKARDASPPVDPAPSVAPVASEPPASPAPAAPPAPAAEAPVAQASPPPEAPAPVPPPSPEPPAPAPPAPAPPGPPAPSPPPASTPAGSPATLAAEPSAP